MANRIRKATIKQNNRPIASDRANPRMAYKRKGAASEMGS